MAKHGGAVVLCYASLAQTVAYGMSEGMEVDAGADDAKPFTPSTESISQLGAKLSRLRAFALEPRK